MTGHRGRLYDADKTANGGRLSEHRFTFPVRSLELGGAIPATARHSYFFHNESEYIPAWAVDCIVCSTPELGGEVVRSDHAPVMFGLVL